MLASRVHRRWGGWGGFRRARTGGGGRGGRGCGGGGGGPQPVPGMGVWRRKVDRSGNTIGPPMEENNHACKALIYYLVDRFGYAVRQRDRQRPAGFILGRRKEGC